MSEESAQFLLQSVRTERDRYRERAVEYQRELERLAAALEEAEQLLTQIRRTGHPPDSRSMQITLSHVRDALRMRRV